MLYHIIADMHGNPQKTAEAANVGCDMRLCLGDIINLSGRNGNDECVEIVMDKCDCSVRGNHDISYAADDLGVKHRMYLAGLQDLIIFPDHKFMITHITPFHTAHDNIIRLGLEERKKLMQRFAREYPGIDVCFMGHEHFPKVHVLEPETGYFEELKTDSVKIHPSYRYFITVGAVNPYSCPERKPQYAVFDTERGIILLKSL